MKRKIFLLSILTLFSAQCLVAQDTFRLFGNKNERQNERRDRGRRNRGNDEIQTLTGKGSHTGFYFGFNAGFSQIDDHDALSGGITMAMIANHSLALGLAGKGFVSEFYQRTAGEPDEYNYAGGYGGLLIEPIIMPKYPIHLSFPVLMGVGGMSYNRLPHRYYPYDYDDFFVEKAGAFLIAEPGVEVELNITQWMRLGLGGTYRFVSSIDSRGLDEKVLNGFSGSFSAKFGIF